MSLTLIATPIGNEEDITIRALKSLKSADCIIGEELKVLRRRLSTWDVLFKEKKLLTLNEHTTGEELEELLKYCRHEHVCLVSDCGTPSFFDPGYDLVRLCRKKNVEIHSLPGVSSLTALMPFLPIKTQEFNVLGFPPQKEDQRKSFFTSHKKDAVPFFLMDTPYRLQKTLKEIQEYFSNSQIVLGVNLTCENEIVVQGTPKECLDRISALKKENFVLMVYPRGF